METSYPPAMVFHKVGGPVELGVGRVSADTFRKQMTIIRELDVETVLASGVVPRGSGSRPIAVLTFDDGYESLFRTAVPTLLELEIRATFFCVAGYLGKVNRWDARQGRRQEHLSPAQLKELSALGFEIGSHGLSHRLLTRLDASAVREELAESKAILEDAAGKPVKSLSYPFGRSNGQVESIAQEVGYERAFGLGRRSKPSMFSIPRIPVYLYDGVSGFRAKLTESSGRWRELSDEFVSALSLGTTLWQRVAAGGAE